MRAPQAHTGGRSGKRKRYFVFPSLSVTVQASPGFIFLVLFKGVIVPLLGRYTQPLLSPGAGVSDLPFFNLCDLELNVVSSLSPSFLIYKRRM